MKITRRHLMLGAAGAGLVAALPALRAVKSALTPLPDFSPIDDPPGFRRAIAGDSTAAYDFLIGLQPEARDAAQSLPVEEVRADICQSLYGTAPATPEVVPLASFSDFYCPYCRVQTRDLATLAEEMRGEVQVYWHELPLLGEASMLAARAALAAKRQGAYVPFQERLISSPFRASPEYLAALSGSLGLDHDRLLADMRSEEIGEEIRTSAAIARIFGFVGTPALVVGRTVIQGRIQESALHKLIALERQEGWTQVC